MRVAKLRMCHLLEIMQRFSVSNVKSIYEWIREQVA